METRLFYESTGLYGKVLQNQWMNNSLFGEGRTLWDSRLLQVLWQTTKGIIYDKSTLTPVGSFDHPMRDGWGLTTDGEHIIGSDGSANLYFMDPSTFKEVRKIVVQDEGRPVRWLNELEYISNEIWSNVFQTECIAQISPKDGKVTGWLLMHGLRSALEGAGYMWIDVLIGIAWDNKTARLFVTGKLWPKVYEIRMIDRTSDPNTNMEKVQKLCML
ncbi:hypothetical protein CY35_02G069000 [Sphagnum magellanicum]|nr:hypothetical protein CY35_02G069000 [Sphagnum magellanicum]